MGLYNIYQKTRNMLLLSTSSLPGYSLHRVFTFAKKSGYDGIDLFLDHNQFDLWDSDYVKGLSGAFNIPVISVTAPMRGLDTIKVEKINTLAHVVNAHVVTFSPPHLMDKETKWFGTLLPLMNKESDVHICVKNIEAKFIFFIIPEYRNASLEQLKKVTGNTAFDISAVDASSGIDIVKAQKILGNSIKNVFLSDKTGKQKGLLPGTAGGGVSYMPLESFFMKLKTLGYKGHVTLAVDQEELGAGNEELIFQNLQYTKEYYLKHFLDYN